MCNVFGSSQQKSSGISDSGQKISGGFTANNWTFWQQMCLLHLHLYQLHCISVSDWGSQASRVIKTRAPCCWGRASALPRPVSLKERFVKVNTGHMQLACGMTVTCKSQILLQGVAGSCKLVVMIITVANVETKWPNVILPQMNSSVSRLFRLRCFTDASMPWFHFSSLFLFWQKLGNWTPLILV